MKALFYLPFFKGGGVERYGLNLQAFLCDTQGVNLRVGTVLAEDYDVVISNLSRCTVRAAWQKVKNFLFFRPTFQHIAIIHVTLNASLKETLVKRKIRNFVLFCALLTCSRIVVPTKEQLAEIPFFLRSRTVAIPNPISIGVPSKRFYPSDPIDFIWVGRNDPVQKNLRLLQEIFNSLSDLGYRCVTIGADFDHARFETIKHLPEPFSYMQQSKVFVNTSAYEGFCNTVSEAHLAGCLVIASDCKYGPGWQISQFGQGRVLPLDSPLSEWLSECIDLHSNSFVDKDIWWSSPERIGEKWNSLFQ